MPDGADPLEIHDVRVEHETTHQLLRELLAKVDALRAVVEREHVPRPVLARVQQRALAALLPEISAAVGSAVWTCRELIDERAHDREMARALARTIGPFDGAIVRRLGCLLSAAEGHVVAGLMVTQHDERSRDGARWSVSRV
jgi:hypothetical protein